MNVQVAKFCWALLVLDTEYDAHEVVTLVMTAVVEIAVGKAVGFVGLAVGALEG